MHLKIAKKKQIPKVIHYCWFGRGKKSDLIKCCINSWKMHCKEYKFIEWNENNFDININKYVSQAYKHKKYAFVSDYVRCFVIHKYGGIYLDTDVELRKSIDIFLKHDLFLGHENDRYISTAIFGAQAENYLIKKFLDYYEHRNFIIEKDKMDLKTNVEIWTQIVQKIFGFELDNSLRKLEGNIIIYPKEYFCMLPNKKENHSIHHFNGSWIDSSQVENYYKIFRAKYNVLNTLINLKYSEMKLKKLNDKLNGKKIVIYGYGSAGKAFEEILKILNIEQYKIIDKNTLNKDKFSTTKNKQLICILTIVEYDINLVAILEDLFHEVIDLFDLLDIHRIIC